MTSLPHGISSFLSSNSAKSVAVTEVPAGGRAVLECYSNDHDHNFMHWILSHHDIIGPGNDDYDERKYKYNVLSGKLHIDKVSPEEAGHYQCISKNLNGGFSVGQVEMIVKGPPASAMDAVKLVAIVVSIIVILSCIVIYLRLRKEWHRSDGRGAIIAADDEDEEEGEVGGVIYNNTTTALSQSQSQSMPGPSRNQSAEHLLFGIDNQGLDTDFNSVFENIQIKSPPSLI